MKLHFLYTIVICTLFFSCSSDGEEEMHYDGANFSAPLLIAGTHQAAARFAPAITSEFTGKSLTGIKYYIQNLPNDCSVRIFSRGTDLSPGAVVYEANVFDDTRSNSWNTHTLTSPIPITGKELWLSVELVHNFDIASMGCDSGPADSNGDFLLDIMTNQWSTFRALTNDETDINWNIRAVISE